MNITKLNKLWMDTIKKSNKNITFISFQKQDGEDYVKVVVKNDIGSKDTIIFKSLDGADNMRSQEWDFIKNKISSGDYANEGSL